MPNVGDIEQGKRLGYRDAGRRIWAKCAVCGAERWMQLRHYSLESLCVKCSQRGLHRPTYSGEGEPQLGDTARATDVGYISRGLRVWAACPKCGVQRWCVRRERTRLCPKCGIPEGATLRKGKSNGRWSTGKRHANGYVFVSLDKSHPLFAMARKVTNRNVWMVGEHRLVMAQHLGRCLENDEVVHHINGDRADNRLENLQLLKNSQHHAHLTLDTIQALYRKLEARVILLEAENIALRSQLEGMLIPSQAEVTEASGVCRDLTGGIPIGMKGKSIPLRNQGTNMSSSLIPLSPTSKYGVPARQLAGKLVANSGNPADLMIYGNPELSGGESAS